MKEIISTLKSLKDKPRAMGSANEADEVGNQIGGPVSK